MNTLDQPRPWNPLRQCVGTNRNGTQCGRNGVPGTVPPICIMHGGAAPQVQKSAKARLLAGADLAIDYLLNLLTPKPPCEHCGRSDADRDPVVVRACQLVLDRSGYGPTATMEVVAAPHDLEDLDDDDAIDRAQARLDRAQQMLTLVRRAKSDDDAAPDVKDGVLLIDDGFEVPPAAAGDGAPPVDADPPWTIAQVETTIAEIPPEKPKENSDD